MDKINVNQIVRVKLTEFGVSVYKLRYGGLNPVIESETGCTSFQLWTLMNIYGTHMQLAHPKGSPFEGDILIGQDDKFRVNAYLKNGAVVQLVYEDEEQFKCYIEGNPIQDAEGTIIMKSEVSYIRAARG